MSVVQTLTKGERPGTPGSGPAARADHQILWVGSRGGLEADIVGRAGLPFKSIHGGGLHGAGWRAAVNGVHLLWGLVEAVQVVGRFRPQALLVTGGFITVPVAVAAWLQRVPVLVYLPDIEPGLAVRFIARLARTIALTVEDSRACFARTRARVVVTGYPTRPELRGVTRAEAVAQLGLSGQRPTVLVTGGSRGARSLNRAVFAALSDWLKDFEVVHLTGSLDWDEAQQARSALPEGLRAYYHARPYLHEMGHALAAADLVVSRAGASALGEYPLFGLPAVLVPYPYAWRYQKVNADYLARRGGAVRLNDEDLPAQLAGLVRGLLQDPERLAAMRQAMAAAGQAHAAERLAGELARLAGEAPPGAQP